MNKDNKLEKKYHYLTKTLKFHNESYHNKGQSFQRKYPNENVIRFIKSKFKKKSLFLDLGCGSGRHINYLINENHKVEGLDFSKIAIKKLIKLIPNVVFYVDYLPNLKTINKKYDGVIDCFTSYSLLREDFKEYVFRVNNILKKNGYFHLQTLSKNSDLFKNYKPSKKILSHSLNRILRKNSPFPKDNYLFTFYDKKYLTRILTQANFTNITIEIHSRTYNNTKEYFEYFVVEAKKS